MPALKRRLRSRPVTAWSEDSIRDQNIHITDTFGPYLEMNLEPDRLSELSKLIQSGLKWPILQRLLLLYKAGSQ